MNRSLPCAALGAFLSFHVAATAFAAPPGPGPGPGMQRGPTAPGPHHLPGPRHGHGLPAGAREVWIGSML
jgi:Spy/CpxP family protein refolding chaperone